MTALSFDRRLIGTIVLTLAIVYFGIFVLAAIRVPAFDPFSYGAIVAESIFAGVFSVIGLLIYIFGSTGMTWKMAKSGSIGRYGRIFYLLTTSVIFLTYCLITIGFAISYMAAIEEKEKQNLLTGLLLVGALAGLFILIYMKHLFVSKNGFPSRYKRHPPVFSASSDKIPK